jgi:hypothetical protein
MTPHDAMGYVAGTMIPYYPLGDYKVSAAVKELG